MNNVQLMGFLGDSPVYNTTQTGTAVCNFSLATNEYRKNPNGGDDIQITEWHRITCFGKLVDVAKTLVKGSKVFVIGSLTTRKWTDKNGVERYTTEVRSIQLHKIEYQANDKTNSNYQHETKQSNEPQRNEPQHKVSNNETHNNQIDDEIPF